MAPKTRHYEGRCRWLVCNESFGHLAIRFSLSGHYIYHWWNFNIDEEKVIRFIELATPKILFVDDENANIVLETINKSCHVWSTVL